MQTVLMTAHIIMAIFLILIILIQRTGSDGLQGLSSSSSAMSGVVSPAASANFMTKLTGVVSALFMINCLVLANLATRDSKNNVLSQMKDKTSVENSVSVGIADSVAPANSSSGESKKIKQKSLVVAE